MSSHPSGRSHFHKCTRLRIDAITAGFSPQQECNEPTVRYPMDSSSGAGSGERGMSRKGTGVVGRSVRSCGYSAAMATFRIREAAELLGVSDDTLRRWADSGRVATSTDGGARVIDASDLAHFAEELAANADRPAPGPVTKESARNRFPGLVTSVIRDTVMAQVVIQAGPHRVVSLMSREAADELQLEPGSLAIASVKATNVVVEIAARTR
jgi:molybdopterin-binding protein